MTDQEQKRVFQRNLSRYVAESGKSQAQISKDLSITPQRFNSYMTGKALPRMGAIQRIADYFGIKKSELIEPDSTLEISNLSDEEIMLILHYRKKSDIEKRMVCKMLDVERG